MNRTPLIKTMGRLSLLLCFVWAQAHSAEPVISQETTPSNLRELRRIDYQKAALVNVELGLGYLSQGQVARAKSKLTHAIQLAPTLAETHSAMAYFLEMVSDFKESERAYKKAVHYSTQKGAVYNNYGAFLCRRGRYKEADRTFQKALEDKDYPRTAEIYENAGLCAIKWPDLAKAEDYLHIAVKRDPNRATTLLALAEVNLKQGKAEEAEAILGQFKSMSEPTARSLWLGIQIASALEDQNAVASQALLLKNLFENSPEYQLYLEFEHSRS